MVALDCSTYLLSQVFVISALLTVLDTCYNVLHAVRLTADRHQRAEMYVHFMDPMIVVCTEVSH